MYIGVRHFEQLMKGVPFFYKQLKQSIWAVHCYFIYFWEGVSLDLNSPISVMFIVAEFLFGERKRYRDAAQVSFCCASIGLLRFPSSF